MTIDDRFGCERRQVGASEGGREEAARVAQRGERRSCRSGVLRVGAGSDK